VALAATRGAVQAQGPPHDRWGNAQGRPSVRRGAGRRAVVSLLWWALAETTAVAVRRL
jgi:hypothetical protein